MAACGASCGITRERARQQDAARRLALGRLAEGPSGASEASASPAFTADEVAALAGRLEAALPCVVRVVDDGGSPGTVWVYLTAAVGGPNWVDFRAGVGQAPVSGAVETALRVGLCPYGRYATLQEVLLRGSVEADGVFVEETRCPGVVDRRLQLFVKATQGLLRTLKVVTLDAAFLEGPLGDDRTETAWEALFDADPMGVTVASYLPVQPGA